MVDKKIGGQGTQLADPSEEVAQVVHELAEALTALGNYVAAASCISDAGEPVDTDIRSVLERASGQHERAATALLQRRRLLTHQKPS